MKSIKRILFTGLLAALIFTTSCGKSAVTKEDPVYENGSYFIGIHSDAYTLSDEAKIREDAGTEYYPIYDDAGEEIARMSMDSGISYDSILYIIDVDDTATLLKEESVTDKENVDYNYIAWQVDHGTEMEYCVLIVIGDTDRAVLINQITDENTLYGLVSSLHYSAEINTDDITITEDDPIIINLDDLSDTEISLTP